LWDLKVVKLPKSFQISSTSLVNFWPSNGAFKKKRWTFMLFQKQMMDLIKALITTDNEGSHKSFKHS
jgi:hypothetical protein